MAQAPISSPWFVQKLLRVPFIFNLLAILLNFVPLFIISLAPMEERLKRYFPIRSFLLGGLMNYFLVCHILIVREKNEHEDSLYVAMMGMVLGFMSAFIWLLHEVAAHASKWARFWMVILVSALVCGSGLLLYSMQVDLHLSKHKGWGLYLTLLASLTSLCLNGYPIVKGAIYKAIEPDYPVDWYGLSMCLFNTLDASYFVVYGWYMGNVGTLLWVTSCITVVFGVVQLVMLVHSLSAPLREVLEAHDAYFAAFVVGMIGVLFALLFVPEEYVPAIAE